MARRLFSRFHLQVEKVVVFSAIVNFLEVIAIFMAIVILRLGGHLESSLDYIMPVVAGLFAIVGAVLNIRDTSTTAELLAQTEQLSRSLNQVEQLNTVIRAQRHDFMNHLQVVHSLIELDEPDEAASYIERVYGDMQYSSRMLRTASVAVNALLSAKIADCENRDIPVEVQVHSDWKNLPMPVWEMCRVLGNILDNAIHALEGCESPLLSIDIYEDLHTYSADISNNGPMIPLMMQATIFEPGITTKGDGHGMGLYNVKQILENYGGSVELLSDASATRFTIHVPRGGA